MDNTEPSEKVKKSKKNSVKSLPNIALQLCVITKNSIIIHMTTTAMRVITRTS